MRPDTAEYLGRIKRKFITAVGVVGAVMLFATVVI
jgi:hypothetical protein